MSDKEQAREFIAEQADSTGIDFLVLVVEWLFKHPSVLLSVFSAYLVWISRSYTDAYLSKLGAGIGWFDYNLFDQMFFSYPAIGLTCITVVLIVTLDVLSINRDRKNWWLTYLLWLGVAYFAFVTTHVDAESMSDMPAWTVVLFWASSLIWLGLPWFRSWIHQSRLSRRLLAARTAGACQGIRKAGITPEIAEEMSKSEDVAVRQEGKRLLNIFSKESKSTKIYKSAMYSNVGAASALFGLFWLAWISSHTASLQGRARAVRLIEQVEFYESLNSMQAEDGDFGEILFNSGSFVLARVYEGDEWHTKCMPSSSFNGISLKWSR